MKKKMFVFLCVLAALFFGSCADLSMNDEEAVKADLPTDFNWLVYGEINNDVKMSQIIFDVREKNKKYGKGTDSTNNAVNNCVDILKDETFAEKVYLEYMKCPELGWNPNEKCSGIYANNGKYTTDTTCVIEGCWYGGWSELTDNNSWQDSLANYSGTTIKAMCQFIPPKDLIDAQKYLEEFPYDSYLVEQHYHFFGRSDGRPYKYCDAVHSSVEKNQSLADRRGSLNNYYYDYGRYTFCLDNTDQKIYVVQ
jgi:hypothetical protein